MDNLLAPTYEYSFGDYWVLWFEPSNCYNVVDHQFKSILDYYLQSKDLPDFLNALSQKNIKDLKIIAQDLHNYLKECNRTANVKDFSTTKKTNNKRHIKTTYRYNNQTFTVYFDSSLVKKVIHAAIAHLEIATTNSADTVFDIYLENDDLFLYKNDKLLTTVPKQAYHKLQGKFMMHLFCTIHNKPENEWIGTFHGSTVSDGSSSVLFIGVSGKGKSTLCALLATQGFELVADDVSPLAANDLNIYTNPAALSVKEGSFDILSPLVDGFESFETLKVNPSKGRIKYIPFPKPTQNKYTCQNIILVNYKKNAVTELESISVAQLMETLIPDTWLSPNPAHAKSFLEWLQNVNMYELTYSDTAQVTNLVTDIFTDNSTT
ncbi:hypothetical protein [Winogradskyella ursingii]|uniref:hypothetical protein n=1 Tax=Winogradskyella ursingii TaxID=2686079 RepID=UPI0015C97642|nr:hypothetical protein [Winogradskyella ursingii]